MRWRWPKPSSPHSSSSSLPLFPSKRKHSKLPSRISRLFPSNTLFRLLLLLCFLALVPPLFFHFRLRRLREVQMRKCRWIENPPLVCAHGGDSTKATPNTMEAFRIALQSHVDCIEVDVSRTSDGFFVALHDRDLQRISGNETAKVGYMTFDQIKEIQKQGVPLVENVLDLVSRSVRQVILDIKVGPPLYEKALANDILSIVEINACKNCLIWAKSDTIARDVIKLSQDINVGYIIMKDFTTGVTSKLGRIKGAQVGGVYHSLINEKLIRTLHRKGEKVYAWTVDDAHSMKRMLIENVDAIVTSNPSMLKSLMQDLRNECLEEGFSLP